MQTNRPSTITTHTHQPLRSDANFHHHICDRTHHCPNPQLKTDTNQKPP
ncbi:hypothetical protein [Kamptonema sp. UHCC 0994]|nr:hypothetical protein [Kamptonema sp. UHCC 0994]MDF0556537.1 hypothetical protein [Kamptonema sp. UHCC 0994]